MKDNKATTPLEAAMTEARRIVGHRSATRDGEALNEILPVLLAEIERLRAVEAVKVAALTDEQGPKIYQVMRERVDARTAADVVAALTGKPADATLPESGVRVMAPLVADVDNDGDRGPRARPLSTEDAARASQVAALMSACGPLDVASLRVLTWIAGQLPATKLRAACEEATATGWCRSDDLDPKVRRTRVDGARSSLLGAVREVEALLFRDHKGHPIVIARRDRDAVLADEVERRSKAGVP